MLFIIDVVNVNSLIVLRFSDLSILDRIFFAFLEKVVTLLLLIIIDKVCLY